MRVIEPEIDEQVVSSGWTTAIAILMILLGIIAIAFPFFASVASTLLFGWIFIFAGITQVSPLRSRPSTVAASISPSLHRLGES